MIQPESTIGMLGGGQLGRMSILAGRHLGYKFRVFEPASNSPAGMVSDDEFNHSYQDKEALAKFANGLSVISLEFENVSADAVETLCKFCPVYPQAEILYTCQNRKREKEFLVKNNLPCAPFSVANNPEELQNSITQIDTPCVVKTADSGYDGKGQIKINGDYDAQTIWDDLQNPPTVVVEKWIQHQGEFSAIVARNIQGEIQVFPIAENIHVNHILHMSIVPARLSESALSEGTKMAKDIAKTLNLVGVLAIEFFLDPEGKLLVNEMAPRPHNSGHYSLDACITSQFEQHIRAVTGMPLGATTLLAPCVMVNILGDAWEKGTPDWQKLLEDPEIKLHLYDKGTPRVGRKMGHFTVLSSTLESAIEKAKKSFIQLMQL